MRHVKLMVFGVVLVTAVIFGFIFWDDLKFNQQEISNTPLPPDPIFELDRNSSTRTTPAAESNQSDNLDSLEADINETDLDIDYDNAELEAEMQSL